MATSAARSCVGLARPALSSVLSIGADALACSSRFRAPLLAGEELFRAPGVGRGAQLRRPKTDCVDIRQGNKIERDGKLFEVVKFEHTRGMARQTGNVQLELRELSRGGARGNKSTLRMKPGHTLNVIRLDERRFRVLYLEGDSLQVMNESTFDQVEVPLDLFEGGAQRDLVRESTFMEEPPEVSLLYYGEDLLSCSLPSTLELVVERSHMGASKQSATAREKDCYVAGGMLVKVPDHVEKGDRIVVDTRDGRFVRKAQ